MIMMMRMIKQNEIIADKRAQDSSDLQVNIIQSGLLETRLDGLLSLLIAHGLRRHLCREEDFASRNPGFPDGIGTRLFVAIDSRRVYGSLFRLGRKLT